MQKNGVFTRVLASTGAALVWLPILSPIAVSAIVSVARRTLLFDYFLPAELFPIAFAGGGLLLWAALRAGSRQRIRIIGRGLGASAGLLVGGQAIAVATGLASGAIEATGWPWALVLASLGLYFLALVALGVGGMLLLGDLHRLPRRRGATLL
jgi:hypothetical protein